jgi:prevent-host-death family protein
MKTISVRDLQKNIRESVETSQSERVVVTKNGQPAAVLIGVEGRDWESVTLASNPAFWKLIEKRRGEKTISLKDMKRRLAETSKRK